MKHDTFITMVHMTEYGGTTAFRIGQQLSLRKDTDNPYDDEAIAIYNQRNLKCGYVANSVGTVARGTKSAGRIYDTFGDETSGEICFIGEDWSIVRIK